MPARTFAMLIAVASIAAGSTCKRSQPVPTARTPIGWTVDSPTEIVRGGRLITTPPGHEEALLPVLATEVRLWASGCAPPQRKSEPKTTIRLAISPVGALRSVDALVPDPFVKCLVEHGRLRGAVANQPGVDLTVDLALDFGS